MESFFFFWLWHLFIIFLLLKKKQALVLTRTRKYISTTGNTLNSQTVLVTQVIAVS